MATQARKSERKPRYLELAEILRDRILAGHYSDDAPFPTEAMLCAEHDVSRFTVREALRKLQSEGFIQRRQGSGTMIQPAAARAGAIHQPLSNVGEILQYARDTSFSFAPRGWVRLPKNYHEAVGIEPDGSWFQFAGVRTRADDGLPIALTEAYIHEDLREAAEQVRSDDSTIFEQLERHAGVTISRVTQDIQAVAAPAAIADQLRIRRRSPCLRIIRCYIDVSGRIFEVSVSHHPGDRFAYAMHIEVEN